jgi:hypothetical protein
MDTLDKKMQTILDSENIPTDQRLKLYDQSLYIYLNVFDDYRPKPEVSTPTPESESPDPIESEILDSVPKTTRGKAELLLKKMKTNRDITWNEKGELKYKDKIVHVSNIVDLVNDVLRKRNYFNPEGWETFGEALRDGNVPQDLIGHSDRWRYIIQAQRTPRSHNRQESPSPTRYDIVNRNDINIKERGN